MRELDGGSLDTLVVCLGGGGLLSGSAVAARAVAPNCRVYGVEPEAGNDVQQSLARGEIVKIPVPQTLADGAQTQAPGELTFAVIRALVAGVATVSDAQLVRTMRFFAERMKLVVEPTGCLAAAAVLEGALAGLTDVRGQRVGIIVSGGNIDIRRYARAARRRVSRRPGAGRGPIALRSALGPGLRRGDTWLRPGCWRSQRPQLRPGCWWIGSTQ